VRTLSRREKGLLALVALAAGAFAIKHLTNPAGTPLAHARAEALPPAIPRIDLARLSAEHPESHAGERDLFRFAPGARGAERQDETEAASAPVPPPSPSPVETSTAASLPSLSPITLKYLGSVESRAGVKVAVLLTDRKEVLTGQAGELVANRYRIARIGLESVDVEDVGSGQSRRIPLRGN
jgi:hypothetical protein